MHGLDAQRLEQQVRRGVEHGDEPAEDGEVDRGRARQPACEGLGIRDREVLGEQLAEDHLHDGRDDEGEHRTDGDAHGGRHADAAQQAPEGLADERLGDVADEQAGDRDAELSTREHEGVALLDRERAPRSLVTVGRARREAHSVNRHVCELLRDEVAVRGDDHEDHDDADEQRHERFEHECGPPAESAIPRLYRPRPEKRARTRGGQPSARIASAWLIA